MQKKADVLKLACIFFVPRHTQQSIATVSGMKFWQSTGSVLKSRVEENCMHSTLCERSVEAVSLWILLSIISVPNINPSKRSRSFVFCTFFKNAFFFSQKIVVSQSVLKQNNYLLQKNVMCHKSFLKW